MERSVASLLFDKNTRLQEMAFPGLCDLNNQQNFAYFVDTSQETYISTKTACGVGWGGVRGYLLGSSQVSNCHGKSGRACPTIFPQTDIHA